MAAILAASGTNLAPRLPVLQLQLDRRALGDVRPAGLAEQVGHAGVERLTTAAARGELDLRRLARQEQDADRDRAVATVPALRQRALLCAEDPLHRRLAHARAVRHRHER